MTIILFGGTGMLGNYVGKYLKQYYQIIILNKNDFNIENDTYNKLENIINNYYQKNKNLTIINCAGIIPQKYSSEFLKSYFSVNSVFPYKLSSLCDKYNINFIHITTDCVFDGLDGNYSINNKHSSNTIYGISKSLGEPCNVSIIRTSIIGEELFNKKSLLEWVISNKNKSINGFDNHFWNGVTCLTLAKYIYHIIDKNLFWKGVKHLISKETVSKYQLCMFINEIYELNINILKNSSDHPKNMTLIGDIISDKSIYEQIKEQQYYIK